MLWREEPVDPMIKSAALVKTKWITHCANTVRRGALPAVQAEVGIVGRLFQV